MTARKDLKNRIRARQARTGESYSAARLQVLRAREGGAGGVADGDGWAGGGEVPAGEGSSERVTAVVVGGGWDTLAVRLAGAGTLLRLRPVAEDLEALVPGTFIEATLSRRWRFGSLDCAVGRVERSWVDVPALGLSPLPLIDRGVEDVREIYEPYRSPDPYLPLWSFHTMTPRRVFEFDLSPLGEETVEDLDDDSREWDSRPHWRDLVRDLRFIDAHAHLGSFVFDRRPEVALRHFEVGVGLGDQALPEGFQDMLLWGWHGNRPFLRALKGQGLCLWRLGRLDEARVVFERILAFSPPDHQGVRFLWQDLRDGRTWAASAALEEREAADGRAAAAAQLAAESVEGDQATGEEAARGSRGE